MNRYDLLNLLLYGADIATRPTYANMNRSYESWLYYNSLHSSQMAHLKTGGLVENSASKKKATWAMRLTDKGRLQALGGRDPEQRWARSWDGQWRFLFFDIPNGNEGARRRLYNWLRRNHFGCLQKSVWITPDPVEQVSEVLKSESTSARAVVTVEGRPCDTAEGKDAEFVQLAWKFDEINRRYRNYIDFAKAGISRKARPGAARDWIRQESSHWKHAVQFDPLLPGELLPEGYMGRRAWTTRRTLLKKAAPMTIALKEDEEKKNT